MSACTSVFVYYAIFTGLLTPLLRLLIRWWQVRVYASVELDKTAWAGTRALFRLLDFLLPSAMSPKSDVESLVRWNFRVEDLATQLKIMLVVALTFGVVYSPLGVVMVLTMASYSCITAMEIEYYCAHSHPQIQPDLTEEIRLTLDRLPRHFYLHIAFKLLAVTSFTTLFFFDTVGDSYGWQTAAWAATVQLLLTSLIAYLCSTIFLQFCSRRESSSNAASSLLQLPLLSTGKDTGSMGLDKL